MGLRRYIVSIAAALVVVAVQAQEQSVLVNGRDTLHYRYTPTVSPKKSDNFKLDFSAAPIYSTSIGWGAAVATSGSYKLKGATNASTITLQASATLKGFYSISLRGVNRFKNDRHTLDYYIAASGRNVNFWGIGYSAAMENTPILYSSDSQHGEVGYNYRIWKNLYIRPAVRLDHIDTKSDDSELFAELTGGGNEVLTTTLSLTLKYDSRRSNGYDQRGGMALFQVAARPKVLGDTSSTSYRSIVQAIYYQPLWKGATLAAELYAQSNSTTTPWQLFPQLGDNSRMRGYYEGRFMDRNIATAQVELRQHIWNGIGVAIWGGGGNSFASLTDFKWRNTLPNYGIGLRYKYGNIIDVRVDYGIGCLISGKRVNGVVIGISESF
ncbi:MAG: hypothetical protein IJX65_02235 [Alistipes sp.]|nr:hypothetical protein [Alistipes sp.]